MTIFTLPLQQSSVAKFQTRLLDWFDQNGRHDLPWQENKTPYRVWVSEIMLQQTQVKTVIPYYQRFMSSFPTLTELAKADLDEVLSHWSGLGYYSRARNLHKAAQIAVANFSGDLPDSAEDMMSLPGIGRSTAGAILAISRKQQRPIQDGNVRRVLSRLFVIDGDLTKADKQRQLWDIATLLTPAKRVDDYTQAIMDLGATVCTRSNPICRSCPFIDMCGAYQQDRVTELPNKKVKKKTPVKQQYFLFWIVADELLMEQRPQVGIWGGLWCPPAFSSEADLHGYLSDHCLADEWINKVQYREPYRHSFSHYKLDIVPAIVRAEKPAVIEESRARWQSKQHWLKAGLPAPIKHLIQTILTD